MDDFLIHGDAELAGVAGVSQEGVAALFTLEEFCGVVVDILGGDAGLDDGHEVHQDAGGDFSGLAQLGDFIGVADRYVFTHGVRVRL